MPGLFLVFEGVEGSGKSTQARLLAGWLSAAGRDVVLTREPGGSPAAEAIRAILLDRQFGGLDPRAEALLFAAARAEHVAQVIRPALQRGAVVICDRYIDSSLAYQGAARGLGVVEVAHLSAWATHGLHPDLTILLDLDPAAGLDRGGRGDRLEHEPLAFHESVRQAFLDRAAAAPEQYVLLDAALPEDLLAKEIRERVAARADGRFAR